MTMKKSKIFIILTLLLFVCSGQSYADLQFSGFFNYALPRGEFKDNIETNGWGLGGLLGLKLGKLPFVLGVDLGLVKYGSDEKNQHYLVEYEGELYDVPDLNITVKNSHKIFQGFFFLRYLPINKGQIRPYVDVMAGLNRLYTVTTIDYFDYPGANNNYEFTFYDPVTMEWKSEEVSLLDSKESFKDVVLSYGLGVGLKIKMGYSTFLDLRMRYLFGGNAEYLKEGAIVLDGSDVSFISTMSKTNLLTFQIGISF